MAPEAQDAPCGHAEVEHGLTRTCLADATEQEAQEDVRVATAPARELAG